MTPKTTLTSAWPRSYQNYVLARLKAVAQAAEVERNMGKRAEAAPKLHPKARVAKAMEEEDDWKLCPIPESPAKGRMTSGPAKRGEASASSRVKVDVEPKRFVFGELFFSESWRRWTRRRTTTECL